MDNVYTLGKVGNRPTLTIHRKPSQIPIHIDMALIRLAGYCHMDGPNSRVMYEFQLPDKFPAAEKYLKDCGWKVKDEDLLSTG